ncbi:MAG: hypothetical protein ABIH26_01940 [Candidatus Eisenbacteria bacterium]
MRRASLLLVVLLLAGCSERSPDEPNGNGPVVRDAPFWTAEGWVRYGDRNFSGAANAFYNALTKDPTYVPAVSGWAWANLELGYTGLSLSEFEKGIALDSAAVDCYYGAAYMAHAQALTFPNQARTRFEQTVEFAIGGLREGGDSYVFEHIHSVNAISLRVLLARSYYGLGQYQDAQDIVDLLDPNNGLSASSPTYLRDLLTAIEGLEELIP